MTRTSFNFETALQEVSASSAGGAPFLIAYGFTFIVTGILSFFLPYETSALIAMFQGGVALPAALWLERVMGWRPMASNNPLKSLSGLLAMSQAFGLPGLIVAYNLFPTAVPVMLAGYGGMHFMAYVWLHRTRVYGVLSAVISLGAFGLVLWLGLSTSYAYILLMVGVAYWVAAPLVYRHAARLAAPAAA